MSSQTLNSELFISINHNTFAKKIAISTDNRQIKTLENFNIADRTKPPIGLEEAIEKDIKIPVNTKSKIKKTAEINKDSKPDIKQNKKPDNYREPIE